MFKKSLILVALVVGMVFVSSFATQMVMTRNLPSSFDTGLTIDEAFRTAETPLLIEFYTDACSTCRRLTPPLHHIVKTEYADKLTVVMLDLTDPANQQIAQLFGVKELPGLYVFDSRKMKKQQITTNYFRTEDTLRKGLAMALSTVAAAPERDPNARPPVMQ